MNPVRADDYIGYFLKSLNKNLADYLRGDVIILRSPIRFGLDDLVRLEIEALHERTGRKRKLPKLVVILETGGGYIEIVERLYNIFRNHYQLVDFIIPNFAYSAGTVLALSGDSIYMDYYSVLGPIDPQYETEDGRYVPGLGYLYKFKRDYLLDTRLVILYDAFMLTSSLVSVSSSSVLRERSLLACPSLPSERYALAIHRSLILTRVSFYQETL